MTFIIALGVIIVLLCTASVFKLMQPRSEEQPKKIKKEKAVKKTKAPKKSKPVKTDSPHIEPSLHEKHAKAPEVQAQKPVTAKTSEVKAPQVVAVYLQAEEGKNYCGYELLQALLSAGMRYGKMNIFHRHEKKTGAGPILFSLASAQAPGTFDLAKIGAFYSKALTLFMQPAEVSDAVKAYELMLEVANQLVEDLGGKVLDERKQLLKKDKVINIHQELKAYQQSKHSSELLT